MQALTLTPAQRKALRAQAHHLDPVVSIGADGLTPGVLKEADAALAAHGLIKLRMFSDSREQRESALRALAERLGAAAVQHIGKLLVLWRPKPAAARSAAPAGVSVGGGIAASAACQSRSNRLNRAIRAGDTGSGGAGAAPRPPPRGAPMPLPESVTRSSV